MTRELTQTSRPHWGLGDAFLATIVAIVAGGVGVSAILAVAGEHDSEALPLAAVALGQVPLWAGLLGIPWWASQRKGAGSLRVDFGLAFRAQDAPIGIAVGLAVQLAVSLVAPLYRLIGIDSDDVGQTAEELVDRAADPLGVVLLVLIAVVGAAIIEEICYRGLWLRALEKRLGATAAIVLSGVLFGAIHFQPLDFLPLALFGMVTAVLTVRYGRLGPAIWAHAAFNGTAVVFLLLDGAR